MQCSMQAHIASVSQAPLNVANTPLSMFVLLAENAHVPSKRALDPVPGKTCPGKPAQGLGEGRRKEKQRGGEAGLVGRSAWGGGWS